MLEIIHCSSKLVEWPLLCFEIKMKKDVKRKKLLNQNELFITISLSFAFKSILVPNGGISPFPQSRPNLFALIFFHLNFLFTVPLIFQEVFVYSPYFFPGREQTLNHNVAFSSFGFSFIYRWNYFAPSKFLYQLFWNGRRLPVM